MGIDLVLEAPVMIDWLRLFAQRFPSVRLQVENITGSEADWFFSKAGMNLALIFASSPSSHCDERLLGHSPVSIVVAKNHPLASLSRPTLEDLRCYRQIVVHARAPEATPPRVICNDHWEVDSGLWALGLAAKWVGWAILPKFLLLGQSPYKNLVTSIDSTLALAPERLVLRSRDGDVDSEILNWWAGTISKYKAKIGLT